MNKYEITIDGKVYNFEEKSHAAIFRSFWNTFMDLDLEKTIATIELVGIRTSELEFFTAQNGSRKKNILLNEETGNQWIYTHLTPKAMENAYKKFKDGWEGTYDPEAKKPKKTKPETAPIENEPTAEPLAVVEPAPEQLTIETVETEETAPAVKEKDLIELAKDLLAQEDYGVDFSDLVPTQKGKITKKYNALQSV